MFGTLEGKREVKSERGLLRIEELGDYTGEQWVWSATVESIDEIWVLGGEHCLTLLYLLRRVSSRRTKQQANGCGISESTWG